MARRVRWLLGMRVRDPLWVGAVVSGTSVHHAWGVSGDAGRRPPPAAMRNRHVTAVRVFKPHAWGQRLVAVVRDVLVVDRVGRGRLRRERRGKIRCMWCCTK